MSLYCIGEVCLQLSPAEADASLAQAEQFHVSVGGHAALFCAEYARLGGHAVLLSQLGQDPFGQRIRNALAEQGVDVSRVRMVPGQTTPVLFADGSRPLAYHDAGLSFPPEDLDLGFLSDASVLHFSTAGLLDGPARFTHLKAISAARDAGVPVSFAPCCAPSLWADAAFLRQTFFLFLPLADFVFLTETDLEFLFDSSELRTALFSLFTGHVQCVVCTGRQGTRLLTRNLLRQSAAVLPIETVCATVLEQFSSSGLSREKLPQWKPELLL